MPAATATGFGLRLLERLGRRQRRPLAAERAARAGGAPPGRAGAAREALDDGARRRRTARDRRRGVVLALAQALWLDRGTARARAARASWTAARWTSATRPRPGDVNAWAAERTRGMVPQVLDPSRPTRCWRSPTPLLRGRLDRAVHPRRPSRGRSRRRAATPPGPDDPRSAALRLLGGRRAQAVRLPYRKTATCASSGDRPRRALAPPTCATGDALATRQRRARARCRASRPLDHRPPRGAEGPRPRARLFAVRSRLGRPILRRPSREALGRVLQNARRRGRRGRRARRRRHRGHRGRVSRTDAETTLSSCRSAVPLGDRGPPDRHALFLGVVDDPTEEEGD